MTSSKTPLYQQHIEAGAKIVDFSGWQMPIHYGSQLEEHHVVRQSAGVFDVSHMNVIDLHGTDSKPFLQQLLANDVARLTVPGKALYSCMLNDSGGIIDDLIVYFMNDDWYRVILNAATHDNDMAWITRQLQNFSNITLIERPELAMLAIQGPKAIDAFTSLLPAAAAASVSALAVFQACEVDDMFVGRTGYTGEDGVEVILAADAAVDLWQKLMAVGVKPIGLGARDTLRLEAGMALYGLDMDESTSPLVSGLGWTVAWQPDTREFIGRNALETEKQNGIEYRMVGLLLTGKGVLRSHQQVQFAEGGKGEITSGSFSPTLARSIALARVPATVAAGDVCEVDIRGRQVPAVVVKYPFVRNGKAIIETEQA
ncbi:MAG: glycine cleavage system aminomethyltransferase GcvT [Gammaproteobacteria bacterium]|nr:glycine cleavage system aminomethyltransferase GcvT [Gammaproteobacteria bacterium]MDX2488773.1 glycine cleavage system aminomethyltransferase GcvT [Gammaproteobacteria bacterium]